MAMRPEFRKCKDGRWRFYVVETSGQYGHPTVMVAGNKSFVTRDECVSWARGIYFAMNEEGFV